MSDMDKNILAMSDEDVLALGPVAFADEQPAAIEQPQEQSQEGATHEEPLPVPDPEPQPQSEEPTVEEPTPTEEQPPVEQPQVQTTPEQPVQEPVEKPAEQQPAPAEDPNAYSEEKGKQALEQLNKLFSNFKASGREIKVDSVDEAIQLMQKGVNYHDKMAGLKPSLQIVRMLEREGLLDESKLGFLIDLNKKNPEAIAKLVKESGIDLLDIDDKKVASYKPGHYALSAQETALEDVMTDLRGSPSFDRVIQFASKQVDQVSKQLIVEKPQLLKLFANQIESGVFDLIQAEVTKQKALGNLDGLNDLEAYDAVGKHLNAQGRFNHLQSKQLPAQQPAPVVVAPKAQKPVDPAVAAAKAAAAPSKSRPTGGTKPAFNPLAMSDEEFEKQFQNRY